MKDTRALVQRPLSLTVWSVLCGRQPLLARRSLFASDAFGFTESVTITEEMFAGVFHSDGGRVDESSNTAMMLHASCVK